MRKQNKIIAFRAGDIMQVACFIHRYYGFTPKQPQCEGVVSFANYFTGTINTGDHGSAYIHGISLHPENEKASPEMRFQNNL
jgi:hypothetical protein